ncbi:MAG: hypothetical protein C0614_07265 [Desulfuromonas sp.]|nr:MAG: hypothetical protein C0614_07265 [Desulfuromonas sp.]
MAKRFLGLDIGPHSAHLAVLEYDLDQVTHIQLLESRLEDLPLQLADLRASLEGDFTFGDRLAAALPANVAYVRPLEFPFRDSKKIMAALPFEMGSRLPVPMDECVAAAQPAISTEEATAKVTAAAVPKVVLQDLLNPADAAGLPLHLLDLAPYAYVAGLSEWCSDGILVATSAVETTVSRIEAGQLTDYRLLPGGEERLSPGGLKALHREIRALTARDPKRANTIYLMGDDAIAELAEQLLQAGLPVEQLTMRLAGEEVPAAFIPAATLALRAAAKENRNAFNFRQGAFALKGEWQKLKTSLWISASLAVLICVVLASAAVINYRGTTKQVDALQAEMVALYRQTFPDSTTIVDVPLQMQSALRDLRERSSLIGGSQPNVLKVLKALSSLPNNLELDLQELDYGPGSVRLAGRTASFDALNQITEHLGRSTLFTDMQVTDAKLTADGNRVNFRLLLTLTGEGGQS